METSKATINQKSTKLNLVIAGVIAIAVAVVGFTLIISLAATPSSMAEAEGTVSGNAKVVSGDASASGSKYLQFGSSGSSTSPTTPPTTTPPTTTPTTPSGNSPSGQNMPVGDLPGWKQIFKDDFTKAAALGSWGSENDYQKIVYTGAEGQKWRAYPKTAKDTYQKRSYRSDQVLSVKNGYLNFNLHTVDGQPAGANPSPVIDGTNQNQTYGRYSIRMKTDTRNTGPYYVAFLLWPQSERWPEDGEEDFPEGHLSGKVGGFHHYAGGGACANGCQDAAGTDAYFDSWHTYTIEWTPGRVKYILDGKEVLNTTKWVVGKPMRWQLQAETQSDGHPNRNENVNLMVDWVSVYKYQQ